MTTLRVPFDNLDFDGNEFAFWEGKLLTGVAYDLQPNGRVWSEVEYIDGYEEGIGRTWYPSGQLQDETTYHHGAKAGPERQWFENGKLKRETIFEHSIRVKERIWDEAGNLIRDFTIDEQHPSYARLQRYH
ncbi:MAG TPA: hypothetical protein VFM49_10800 [Chloroflexia bacterium]|jgi:antitoxin component YwqK of YwqJK toxin-antitoxin module|nr:hypothetical protein [Chloroflexia bacterium]